MLSLRHIFSLGMPMAITIFIVAWASTGAGYAAATNESIDYPDMEENVAGAMDQARTSLEENVSTPTRTLVWGTSGPVIILVDAIATSSVEFGYGHPRMAKWYLRVSPIMVIGFATLYAFGTWREWRRDA